MHWRALHIEENLLLEVQLETRQQCSSVPTEIPQKCALDEVTDALNLIEIEDAEAVWWSLHAVSQQMLLEQLEGFLSIQPILQTLVQDEVH